MRGQPDFGGGAAVTGGASQVSFAELAARLGSINIYDMRGRVLWLDDFEPTMSAWVVGLAGTASWKYDNNYYRSGNQCLKLSAPTGDISFTKFYPEQFTKRLGVEIAFSKPDADTAFRLGMAKYDGTDIYYAELKIDFSDNKVYLTSGVANAFVERFTHAGFLSQATCYYPVKLVADFATKKFVRLLIGGDEWDLSDLSLGTEGFPATVRYNVQFQLEQVAGAGGDLYVDDYIFTHGEP